MGSRVLIGLPIPHPPFSRGLKCPLRNNIPWVRLGTVRGGVLVSTRSSLRILHAEDDSLASLKIESHKINADYEDLALAA